MKKFVATILVASSMFLFACTGNQGNNIFENESFSLKLPAPYATESNVIQPKTEKAFPTIVFGDSNEKVEKDKLLEFSENWFKNLCEQSDSCGQIIKSENIVINDNSGLKFTVQYPGRSLEDQNGYINEYHYTILNGENLLQFWTSASDLEDIEKISNSFDEIIETLSLKNKE